MSNPVGRPSDYRPDVGDIICERLVEGESLRAICRSDGMPSISSVFRWIHQFPEFREQYERAREWQAEKFADEMLDIADDATNDFMERVDSEGRVSYDLNGEHVQRSKIRLDARKWVASKLKPKKFGDKIQQEHTGADGAPLAFVLRDMTKASD